MSKGLNLLFLIFSGGSLLAMQKQRDLKKQYKNIDTKKAILSIMPPIKNFVWPDYYGPNSVPSKPTIKNSSIPGRMIVSWPKEMVTCFPISDDVKSMYEIDIERERKKKELEKSEVLLFHDRYQKWISSLSLSQKTLLYLLPVFSQYRVAHSGYFYSKRIYTKEIYDKSCEKMQELMDFFDEPQLPKRLERVKSFCLSTVVRRGAYDSPYRVNRNKLNKEYLEKREFFLQNPFNYNAYLEVVALQETISNLVMKEKLRNDELLKKE